MKDQNSNRERADNRKEERPPCNSLRRASYVFIGLCGLLVSCIGLRYALRYGIYQTRNWQQNVVAFSSFILLFSVAVQAAIFLLNSTASDCDAEDIRIFSVVIPELELGDIQMRIFFADLMESPDNAALQDRPEAFDGLRVDRTDDVLTAPMVNDTVAISFLGELPIAAPSVSAKQADLVRYGFIDEGGQRGALERFSTTRATTLPLRRTAPTTIDLLPTPVPPPLPPPRLSLCLFSAFPPTSVSSTSTMPPSLPISSVKATRTLWHMSQAVL